MFPIDTPQQLRIILRSLRQARGLTQAQLGDLIGVSQKRIARIESAPEVTAFDQISRMIAALGGRIAVEQIPQHRVAESDPAKYTPSW